MQSWTNLANHPAPFVTEPMGPEQVKRQRFGRQLRARAWAALLVLLLAAIHRHAACFEYGFLNDFHFSVREELDNERSFQIDNYYALDAYRLLGRVDFHSGFLVTNDLALLDTEAAQLTLAYLDIENLLGPLGLNAGRQFFAQGFDAFLGDGVIARYRVNEDLQFKAHFAVPFDAESEAIDNEPMRVYGFSVTAGQRGRSWPAPFQVTGQVERRDRTDAGDLDQTLIGLETSTELAWPLESDVFADLEYEAQDSRMRRAKIGSQLYLSPVLVCRLEGERFEPEQRDLRKQFRAFLQEAITNYFSSSEVWSGSVAVTYDLPEGRELRVSYSGQWYTRRSGDRTFGNGVDGLLTLLRMPSLDGSLGAGYSGRIVERDSIHLGVLRADAAVFPSLRVSLLTESGIMDNRRWRDEFVLHARGTLRYLFRPNLEVSLILEENKNPYFESDLRTMAFVRYFWGRRQ